MRALSARTVVVASLALAAIVATGCTPTPNVSSERTPAAIETSASSDGTAAVPNAAESSAAPTTTPITTTPAPVPAPPQPTPKPAPKVKLGPKDAAVSWAYLKDMYKKDGYWYVVVDYVQVVGPEETIHFVNENPRLRTFPLSSGAKLQLLKSPGSPIYKSVSVAQFKAFENKSGDEVVEVTPKGGYAMKLKQWWAP